MGAPGLDFETGELQIHLVKALAFLFKRGGVELNSAALVIAHEFTHIEEEKQ
jgi:hypothetical protein